MTSSEPPALAPTPVAPAHHQSRLQRFLGWALFVSGIAMLAICGTCTGGFLLWSMLGSAIGMVPIVLLVGGIPTGLGAVAFWIGRRIVKGQPIIEPGVRT